MFLYSLNIAVATTTRAWNNQGFVYAHHSRVEFGQADRKIAFARATEIRNALNATAESAHQFKFSFIETPLPVSTSTSLDI